MKYNRNIITRLLLKTIKGTSYVGFVLAAISGQEQTPPFYHDRRLQWGGSGDVALPSVWMLFFHKFDMFGDTLGKLLGKALFSFQLFLLEVLTHAVSPNLGD